jgi:hypothetical protein
MKKINKIGTPLGSILIGDNCGEGGTFIVKKLCLTVFHKNLPSSFWLKMLKIKYLINIIDLSRLIKSICNTYKLLFYRNFILDMLKLKINLSIYIDALLPKNIKTAQKKY